MNHARGEVEIVVDGKPHQLCLTLGGLAELETLFACQSLQDLQARLKRLSAREMRDVLGILLVADSARTCLDGLSPTDAARGIAEAFLVALG